MKSIGNGWKRAQMAMAIAKKREGDNILRECVVNHNMQPLLDRMAAQQSASYEFQQEAYMRDRAIRAMSPEAMKEKAEREAPLSQNAYAAEYAFTPAGDGKTKPKTLWQRIKHALRAL